MNLANRETHDHGHPDATLAGRAVAVGADNHGDIDTGDRVVSAQHNAQIIYAEKGATVLVGNDASVPMPAVDRASTLGRYLQHLISQNRTLQLQGIRSGGKLVSIELDRIYITLRATRQFAQRGDAGWLADECALAPGERQRAEDAAEAARETSEISVNQALAEHRRLVVLGDPGCGKTTLLRYLALLYARDVAESSEHVRGELGLAESGALPIFLPLRLLARYLGEQRDDGTEGHLVLLRFYSRLLANERIAAPENFFDDWLRDGRAVLLLDGLDEVADPALRRRVARRVDDFTRAYPECRYVVTSRIVGYSESSQLGAGYATTTVRDFTLADVRCFLTQWHRLIAIGQMGAGDSAEAAAAQQTAQLLAAIEANERVRELAINPLLLTVIALVHRDRVKLPDRRAELYQEAVDVLLGKWDDAKGVAESRLLGERPFDTSDRRLVLQRLALQMQTNRVKEIDQQPLHALLVEALAGTVSDARELAAAADRLLRLIQERAGLLIARGEGSYAFSHLTFQEYLAALAIAGRDDYVELTLAHSADPWWREVILLTAGHLSTQSKERTTRLIAAIADSRAEPEPYHNLVLAAECVRDAGSGRLTGDLEVELRRRLHGELDRSQPLGWFEKAKTLLTRGIGPRVAVRRRIAAAEALGKIGGHRFWSPPYGEPEWVDIAAGEFTMGEESRARRVYLPTYAIARVPITNAQYALFVQASGHSPPGYWQGTRPPRGKESHPVVRVSWHSALAYCRWLAALTGKAVALPSEAEWEKAARGAADARTYPWGERFDAARCNVSESGFGGTTPVGVLTSGASPYGCLDMAGNVWEWTRSVWADSPCSPDDPAGEDLNATDDVNRVVRGGSWLLLRGFARCAFRYGNPPPYWDGNGGFRVVLRRSPVS